MLRRAFLGLLIWLVIAVPLVIFAHWTFNSIGMEGQHFIRFMAGMVIGWAASMVAVRWVLFR